MANSKVGQGEGFGRSDRARYIIPSGQTGSSVFRVDLGRPYAYHVVRIENCTGFATGATISCQTANDDSPAQAMCDLYELNDPSTLWSKSVPVTGTCTFVLTHTFGARYLKFISSLATDANVNIDIYGYDPGAINTPSGV